MEDFLEMHGLCPYMTELSQSSSAIRKMDGIAREMAEKYGEESIHNFSLGNPRVPPPKEYNQIMIDTINDDKFFYLMDMPQIQGIKKEEKLLLNCFLKFKK